ncbi:hypothetical protein, partial [Paenibacillus xylanexedens]|uniref:hypothetical protein n=1 Tax=Paenibacillus xylanexedens TaxID=528191 RepID=UPI0028EA9DBC
KMSVSFSIIHFQIIHLPISLRNRNYNTYSGFEWKIPAVVLQRGKKKTGTMVGKSGNQVPVFGVLGTVNFS